jgi:hypothetical protein
MGANTPLCPLVQAELQTWAGCSTPHLKRDRLGYLEALLAPANRSGMQTTALPATGKRRQLELTYWQRDTEAAITPAPPNGFCDGTDERLPLSQTVDIKQWVHRKLRLTEDQLRRYCFAGSDGAYITQLLFGEMNALLTAVDRSLLALQAAQFGTFASGSLTQSWIPLNTAPVGPNFLAESQALEAYAQASGCGTPMVIGAGDLAHYVRLTERACCNGAAGVDLARMGEFLFFYDRHVNPVLNTGGGTGEHYLMLAPGAVQFLTWQANVGSYAYTDGRNEADTLMDPYTGVLFDFDRVWDPCTKAYTLTLSLNYDLFLLPADAFSPSDALAGVNYTFHFVNP